MKTDSSKEQQSNLRSPLVNLAYRVSSGLIAWQQRHGKRYPSVALLRMLRLAAHHGHISAQAEFGLLMFGNGACRMEKSTGLEYLRLAARAGEIRAQYQLGMSYMQGCALIDRDAHAAAYWFSLAQSQGHPEALTALRRLQESRESAEKNAELAERVA